MSGNSAANTLMCSSPIPTVELLSSYVAVLFTVRCRGYLFNNYIYTACNETLATELLGFGLFPSSDILENREHDVSEAESVSVFRWE
jgi:hypothetical protein